MAISADGSQIVGVSGSQLGPEAYVRTAAQGMTPLGDFSGGVFHSKLRSLTPDGSYLVGYGHSPEGTLAALWTSQGMQPLGELPGGEFHSDAWDISADASIIVGMSRTDQGDTAFLWDTAHGMRDLKTVLETDYGLDLTGWHLEYARGISDDGMTIVGYGTNPQGYQEGWVATIPEPCSLAVLTLGCLFLKRKRL